MRNPGKKCEWCEGMGLITVYHRLYQGSPTVYVEYADQMGEVHTRREPGTIAVHCSCALGSWMRERVEDDDRRRIPTLSDVINGRVPYVPERPDFDDEQPLTPAANAFLRRWKDGFGGRDLPRAAKSDPIEVSNQLRARNARIEAERAEEVATS